MKGETKTHPKPAGVAVHPGTRPAKFGPDVYPMESKWLAEQEAEAWRNQGHREVEAKLLYDVDAVRAVLDAMEEQVDRDATDEPDASYRRGYLFAIECVRGAFALAAAREAS